MVLKSLLGNFVWSNPFEDLNIQGTTAQFQTQGIGGGQDAGDKAFSKAQTQGRKYAFMLALNTSTGDDPESDVSTDKADTVLCRKCGKDALFVKMGEFEDKQVKCYTCPVCKTETRKEAYEEADIKANAERMKADVAKKFAHVKADAENKIAHVKADALR